jgi:hypothetical protein
MKARLLKKLRKEAKKKYTLEVHHINDRMVDYCVVMNVGKTSSTMFHYNYIDDAIKTRNKLRRNDIIRNVGIIRYKHFMKRFK